MQYDASLEPQHSLAKALFSQGAPLVQGKWGLLGQKADFLGGYRNEFTLLLLKKVFLRGYFAKKPEKAEKFLAIIEEAMSEGAPQSEIYGRLRHFLRQDRKAKKALQQDDKARVKRRVNQLSQFLPTNINSFLDLGNGNGNITEGVAKHFGLNRQSALGVDMVERAKESKYYKQAYVSPEETLPCTDNSIELVTMLMVLHHLHEPKKALAEVFRVLKPGGMLLIRESDAVLTPLKSFCAIMEDFYYKVFNYYPSIPLPNFHLPITWWVQIIAELNFQLTSLEPVEEGNPFVPVYLLFKKP